MFNKTQTSRTLFGTMLLIGTSLATTLALAVVLPAPLPAPTPKPATETHFGITVEDPDRRLEDLKDPEVQAWMKAQAERTRNILDALPGRAAILADIDRLDRTRTSTIQNLVEMRDGRLLVERREAGTDSAKLMIREGLAGSERALVDPEDWRKRTGKPHAINYVQPSPDGKLVLVGISESGSEMGSAYVFDIASGKQIEAPISRIWFGVSWLPDSRGFVYNRMNALGADQPVGERILNSQAYLHLLGTDAEQDPLVFGNRHDPSLKIEPAQIPYVTLSSDSEFMIGFPSTVDNQVQLYVAPRAQLEHGPIQWRKVVDRDDKARTFELRGNDLYLLTTDRPNRRIERLSLVDGKREVVVTDGAQAIDEMARRDDALYYTVRQPSGVGASLYRLPWGEGTPAAVATPGFQTFLLFPAQEGVRGMVIGAAGWSQFPAVLRIDERGKAAITDVQPQPQGLDPSALTASIVEVPSHDGVKVPLSIVHRSDLKRDGRNPTLLQGYGAYGSSTPPYLTAEHFAYFDRGFVRAFCHVRGGGEKGEAWYRGGFQGSKANTWKDFNACAQYLVDNGYTSPQRLGALGGSAGGILIGNAMIERPDLYRVMFPSVGVMDSVGAALRDPNGPGNWPEFGDPNTEAGFKSLHAMSSFYKVQDGTAYPAVMLIHGVEDPRVAVWQSNKMAARLQRASSSGLPILLRLDYEAGHGVGSTRTQANAERADIISFMLWQFGIDDTAPARSAD